MRTGKIIQVSGSVVDVRFPQGGLPRIREALSVEVDGARRDFLRQGVNSFVAVVDLQSGLERQTAQPMDERKNTAFLEVELTAVFALVGDQAREKIKRGVELLDRLGETGQE